MASPKLIGKRMSWQEMESTVKELAALSIGQKDIIKDLQSRLSKTEQEQQSQNNKIRHLQHGLSIANLRAPSTIFHVNSWRAHKAAITCIGWFGSLLLTGSTDKSLRVWDLADETYAEIQVVRGHKAGICIVAAAGDLVATASGDLTVKLWDPRLGWNCVSFRFFFCVVYTVSSYIYII